MSTSSEESEDDAPPPSAIEAINNPLILQCILENVNKDITSIKRLRLVSKSWNKLILTLPDTKLQLMLNSHKIPNVADPAVFINFSKTMDKRLARDVRLTNLYRMGPFDAITPELAVSSYGWSLEAVGYLNLEYCLRNFSSRIQTIDLSDAYLKIDFVPVLHQLLQQFCPNLKKLRLYVDSVSEENDDRQRPPQVSQTWRNTDLTFLQINNGVIPVKRKLQIIVVELLEGQTQPPRVIAGHLHDLYQSLINAGPNIIGLSQKMVAFPDCSRLTKIKCFTFQAKFHDYDFKTTRGVLDVNFDLKGLVRMLQQMAPSLEYLQLKVHHKKCTKKSGKLWCFCSRKLSFLMPQMVNLKIFKVSDTDIFFQDVHTLSNITCPGRSDQLKHLDFGKQIIQQSAGIYQFVNEITDISRRTKTIISTNLTILSINGVSDWYPISKLKSSFPALKTLSVNKTFGVKYKQTDDSGDSIASCSLAQALAAAETLELEKFDVTVPLPNDLDTFVTVLRRKVRLFRRGCLKKLFVTGTEAEMDMDEAIYTSVMQKLEDAFFAMRDMESVEIINCGINFPAAIGQKLYRFIDKNSLPVDFK